MDIDVKLVTVNIDAEENDLLVPLDLEEGHVHKYLVGIYPDFDVENNLLKEPVQLHKCRMGYLLHKGLRIMMTAERVLARSGVLHVRKIPETNLAIKDLYEFNKAIDEASILVLHFDDNPPDDSIYSELSTDFVCTLHDLDRLTQGGWPFGDTVVKRISCPGEGCVYSDVSLEEDLFIGTGLKDSHYALCDDGTVRLIDPTRYLLWFGLDKSVGEYANFIISRGEDKTVHLPGTLISFDIGVATEDLRSVPVVDMFTDGLNTVISGRVYLDQSRPDVYCSVDLIVDPEHEVRVFAEDCEIYPENISFQVKRDKDTTFPVRLTLESPEVDIVDYESSLKYTDPLSIYDSLMYSLTEGEFRLNKAVKELRILRRDNPYILAIFLFILNKYRKSWKTSYPINSDRLYNPFNLPSKR